ncbi:hypothetical protein GC093_24380 [Paenibacillus sp. LMG 31456]|uniref:Uncharacterized protein n=1 Tax=Paenibacillus foliorum TaxID=2654974 RepID=A0A972GXG8_9BACL|nr:hypothetical protein [Paenibacillus foliorum]NOU96329.1 hypothetical protein [Paenibacillus foliorum]
MLREFLNQDVNIYFIDGQNVHGGKITDIDEKYVKYESDVYINIIPISSIRSVQLQTGERKNATAVRGFSLS